MADLTRQVIVPAGLTPAFAAAAGGGDTLINDDRTFLVVKNGGAGSINVTITAQRTKVFKEGFGELTISDLVVAVGAGAEKWITAPTTSYNNATGRMAIAYSGVTTVTVGGFQVPAS